VTEREASDSGIRSVEHIVELSCWQGEPRIDGILLRFIPLPDSIARQHCAAVAARFRRNGTWLVPTLAIQEKVDGDSAIYEHVVTLMHRAGMPMLAGSDAVGTALASTRGSALHNELEVLVRTGFTPAEALQTATVHVATFFHAMDTLGTIAPGKVADCVLLDANPLTDIHNTRTVRAVVANGHYFDRPALDTLR
jgi:imidazolonepropionase-like amidohydrolase